MVLEYDIGVAKDVFTFLFPSRKPIDVKDIHGYLHSICLFFYANFNHADLDISFQTDDKFTTERKDKFSPFEQFGKAHQLTRIQTDYLKTLATGIDISTLSNTLNRSERTVESAISLIKKKLDIGSKQDLVHYLQLYYNKSIYEYFSPSTL